MEDGFQVVCQQVVLFLPLFRNHPLCGPAKRIQISFCTGADELSQQLAVRHSPYAAFISNLTTELKWSKAIAGDFRWTCAALSHRSPCRRI